MSDDEADSTNQCNGFFNNESGRFSLACGAFAIGIDVAVA